MSYKNVLDMQTTIYGLLNDMDRIQSIQEDIISRLDRMEYKMSTMEKRLSILDSYLTEK